jgi:hypothetical protein
MSLGVKVALRCVLNEDVAEYIQQIANSQRRELMNELHMEYFQKLAKLIENKIDDISLELEEIEELRRHNPDSFSVGRWYFLDEKKWVWSYILDDIFYKSGKIVNSRYRPDQEMM